MRRLEYYQNKFKSLPTQGSSEWLEGRLYSFGGSEMATVCENNPYETFKDLKDCKIKKETLCNDAVEWGKLFEPIAKLLITKQFGNIYEFGSIPHCYYPVCYSPDGLMVIDDKLVLLEIKTPIQRGIKKIPEPYIYQVQTGLNVIAANYCLFAQFRFRRCTWKTSGNTVGYDRAYHLEFRKRQIDMKPFYWGYFHWDIQCPLKDLAKEKTMASFLHDIHVKPRVYMQRCESQEAKEMCENALPTTGVVLKWKCFEVSYSTIKPDKTFLVTKEEMLWKKYEEMREAYCLQNGPATIPETSVKHLSCIVKEVTAQVVADNTKYKTQTSMHSFTTKINTNI